MIPHRRHVLDFLLDVPWIIMAATLALLVFWTILLMLPYCLVCLPTFEGFSRYGQDDQWTRWTAACAAVALLGMMTRRVLLRVVVLFVLSCAVGFAACCFLHSPTPAPGLGAYSVWTGLLWWGLWWETRHR